MLYASQKEKAGTEKCWQTICCRCVSLCLLLSEVDGWFQIHLWNGGKWIGILKLPSEKRGQKLSCLIFEFQISTSVHQFTQIPLKYAGILRLFKCCISMVLVGIPCCREVPEGHVKIKLAEGCSLLRSSASNKKGCPQIGHTPWMASQPSPISAHLGL